MSSDEPFCDGDRTCMPPIHEPLTVLQAVRFALPKKSSTFLITSLLQGFEAAFDGALQIE
jgi:hypothetical protein